MIKMEGDVKMDRELLFKEFLAEYLERVKNILPDSHRAHQLEAGGVEKALVINFETRFLKDPFMKVINKILKEKE